MTHSTVSFQCRLVEKKPHFHRILHQHLLASEAGAFPERRRGSVHMDSLCLVGGLLTPSWTVAAVCNLPHFFFAKVEGSNESEANRAALGQT